MNGNQTVIRR